MHRTRDLAFYLQDRICSEYGISLEQYEVLTAIKYLDPPVKVGEVASWMGHRVNSASMIADRMFRAGLLDRFRDLPDRREVRLTITEKGEEALKQATPALWAFIETTMSSLSDDEKSTLIDLLDKVRTAEHQHFAPDEGFRISSSYDTSDPSRLIKRLGEYVPPPASMVNRPDALSRGSAAPGPRPTRARSTRRKPQKGVPY